MNNSVTKKGDCKQKSKNIRISLKIFSLKDLKSMNGYVNKKGENLKF
jgi:hypothetical protein